MKQKLSDKDIEEIVWFVKNKQLRPNLISNIYRITKDELQQIIDTLN